MTLSFVKTIYLSLFPQPKTYKKLLARPLPFAYAYLLVLILILNTLFSFVVLHKFFTSKNNYFTLKPLIFKTLDNFPKDLVVVIDNGILTSSYNKPYFFAYPILVIDEFATDKQIVSYRSSVVLNKDSIAITRGNSIAKFSYPHMLMQISKSSIKTALPLIKIAYAVLPFIAILYLFVITPFIMIIKIFILLILLSFLFHIIFRKTKHRITYISVFHLGLYSSTLPILCYYVIRIMGGGFKTMVWLPILVGIFLLAALYEVYIYNEKPGKSGWSLI